MSVFLGESQLDIAAVGYFRELGYEYAHGPETTPDGEASERQDYGRIRRGKAWLIERDSAKLDDNEFLVVNQFNVIEGLKRAFRKASE